ncbi:polysaccharide pyruvyl transferase family protein, partial [Patescibacteria group bacterium]
MTQNKEKIIICGHYGASNIGDEAILISLLQNLNKVKPDADITILSYDPKNTKNFHNIKSNYLLPLGFRSIFRGIFKGELRKTLRSIKHCDKFILGGGGLFTDEKIFAVFLWGLHAFVALKYKKPLYMLGQSVGPLKTKIGKWIARKAFVKAKMIYVRDEASKELLEKLSINNEIIVAPDLVFSLDLKEKISESSFTEVLNKKIAQEGLKGYFLISLRPWKKNFNILNKNIDQAVDVIVRKYKLLPVFVPYQTVNQNDEQLMHKIVEQSSHKYPSLIKKFEQ